LNILGRLMVMPEKSWQFIEAKCLQICRLQLGCRHLMRVVIAPIKPSGSGPNWEILAFEPELPPIAHAEAVRAANLLRGKYALAPGKNRKPPVAP
jgi:hypothetical protein